MTFELRLEGQEGGSHALVWGRNISGGGQSRAKIPEAGRSLVWFINSQKAGVSRVESMKG